MRGFRIPDSTFWPVVDSVWIPDSTFWSVVDSVWIPDSTLGGPWIPPGFRIPPFGGRPGLQIPPQRLGQSQSLKQKRQ